MCNKVYYSQHKVEKIQKFQETKVPARQGAVDILQGEGVADQKVELEKYSCKNLGKEKSNIKNIID